ncbi:MAG: aldehyde dehydrogenase family protein [Thermoleophilaceae bacterium]
MEAAVRAESNGQTTTQAVLESFNPATGETVGAVPKLEPADVQAVVDDVAEVQPFWAQLPLSDRARYMRRAAQVILDNLDDLSELLSREQGKPRTEALTMELLPTVDGLHWIAGTGPEILAEQKNRHVSIWVKNKRHFLSFEPLGVVGVIAPWNYPWTIPFGEVAIALMCGNGVVLKPASLTPLIGERIQWVFERAGLPEGIVRCVHGGGAVGNALVESSAKKIFFTGSVEVGRRVGIAASERLKGSVLELGGKDAMVVLADANLENAASGCLWGGFANAGQTCSGIERVYVTREISDRFVERVVAGAKALRVGDPLSYETEIGPMVSQEQFEIVKELVDDAVTNGATMHCGGPDEERGGTYYRPTVLTGVTHEMRIMKEEIFGPVVPIITVDSEEEAVRLANDSEFGLGASVWSRDRQRAEQVGRQLESGMVWLNDHMYTHGVCSCAWGGVKSSGLGRAHSQFGFYECVNIKQMSWDPSLTRNFWWFPYEGWLGKGAESVLRVLYSRDEDKRRAVRHNMGAMLRTGAKTLFGARTNGRV